MKTLILMRHAKSSWDDPLVADHDRVLNGRGRASADAMGVWLRDRNYLPGEALVSDAARTTETFARLGFACAARILPALYHAGAPLMLKVLQGASADTVLMVGHNPGIADFATELVVRAPDHDRFRDYPTCATLVVAFDIEAWRDLRPGSGRVLDFTVPREVA